VRTCTDCGETKPLEPFFQRIAGRRRGYYGRCKVCRNRRNRERYARDPEAHRKMLEREAHYKQRRRLAIRQSKAEARARRARLPSIDDVLQSVVDVSSTDRSTILGPSRRFAVADARAAAAVLLRTVGGLTAIEIGQVLGRDDETVYDLIRTLKERKPRAVSRTQLVMLADAKLQPPSTRPAPTPRAVRSNAASGLLHGLREAREAAGISIYALAERTDISRETLSRLEHLHRATSLRTLRALATALQVDPGVLTANRRLLVRASGARRSAS